MNFKFYWTFIFIIKIFIIIDACVEQEWNYGNKGPDYWPHHFSECAAKYESPINIIDENSVYDSNLVPFQLNGFNDNSEFIIANKNLTVFYQVSNITTPLILRGSDLTEDFKLIQFHFHWGQNDYQGSEHFINGDKFPLEMHFVYRSPSNKTAVLAFLFELSNSSNPRLDSILETVLQARDNVVTQVTAIKLSLFLPPESELKSYWRYIGSLTVPPCTEDIIWNVFKARIPISHSQLGNFRVNTIKTNFRNLQPINGRTVYSSTPLKPAAAFSRNYNY